MALPFLARSRNAALDVDRIRVASPCLARWEDMVGDDRVRHCGRCELDVYDSTGLSAEQLRTLVTARAGDRVCLRLHRRADGRLITRDCPVGLRWFYARLSSVAALLLGAIGLPALRSAPASTATSPGGRGAPATIPGDRRAGMVSMGSAAFPDASDRAHFDFARQLLRRSIAALDEMTEPSATQLERLVDDFHHAVLPRPDASPTEALIWLGDAYHVRARIALARLYALDRHTKANTVPGDALGRAERDFAHGYLDSIRRDLDAARVAYALRGATAVVRFRLHPWMPERREPARFVAAPLVRPHGPNDAAPAEIGWTTAAEALRQLERFAAGVAELRAER